ncbi:hypothetical protein DHX103_02565 [Planococcus sp. X10-3]|uniref:hypothetical protein n=1 Tax=Planococcus sp. X10-3 TaxID=3061240 RepID=UPI003BAF3796
MSESTRKLIHIRLDAEDIFEYQIEAKGMFGDEKRANAMIIAEIKRAAEIKRKQRLGVKTVSEQSTGKPMYNAYGEITGYE